MSSNPRAPRLGLVAAAALFAVALIVVAVVASSSGDDGGGAPDTQETLTAVEVFLDGEGIENYDLATLDLAVEAIADSCANDDTVGFRLTYALTLQGDGNDDELARAVVRAICPERIDELPPPS